IAELTQTNFTGPVTLMNKILPVMLSQQSGHIVNIGSMVTRMPTTFEEVYSGAKLGLRGITETLDFGYKNKGINFSILEAPGLSGEGIMHRIITKTKVKTPRIFPVVSVQTMSKKVLKTIKKRQVVVLVMPRIMMPRLMGKMLAIFPGLGGFMVKRMGILSFMEHVVDYRLENYDSYTATISS
ncbi:MAG: SDR family oxidoreductase, partial [Candidatus Heimdallarchaeota archaeon]|nr:SDR family oxidoreductase [Candidatus Heimdallarchaeota archaeon]